MNMWIWILIIDYGLVILVWMTQLISYPGFAFVEESKLLEWHASYTWRITVIVMPLMFAQVGLKAGELLGGTTIPALISAALVALIWLSTFLQAVPLHNQIAAGTADATTLASLVKVNWIRTVLWTLVFGLDALRYFWLIPKSAHPLSG